MHFLTFCLVTVPVMCLASEQNIVLNDSDNITCSKRYCINKCCPKDEYAINDSNATRCSRYELATNFSDVPLYDIYIHDELKFKSLGDIFVLLPGKFSNETFASNAYNPIYAMENPYLNENGTLYTDMPNSFKRWTEVPNGDFCLDYFIDSETGDIELSFMVSFVMIEEEDRSEIYLIVALIVSSSFLAVVLIVYCLLSELRNLCGKVLMAYVTSLMCAFLLLATIHFGPYDPEICINLTAAIYYFFIATFCWMNVMSYDIWWTFRGYAKARPIHRRGKNFKFCMYCLYAWGVPLLMAIVFIVINDADLSDKPWIVKPLVPLLGCFMRDGQLLVYMHIPMLILIASNVMFFIMTAFNIYRLNRGNNLAFKSAASGDPAAHRVQRQRFMLYLKLSIIMGLNWVLEYVSIYNPHLAIWYVTDMYNVLIGIAIFLIFICKKSIYNKLKRRFQGKHINKYAVKTLNKSNTSNTMDSNLSQEIPLNEINSNPKGQDF